jgi:hypothetical protein
MTQQEHHKLKRVRLLPDVLSKVAEEAVANSRTIPAEANVALRQHYSLPNPAVKRPKAK